MGKETELIVITKTYDLILWSCNPGSARVSDPAVPTTEGLQTSYSPISRVRRGSLTPLSP